MRPETIPIQSLLLRIFLPAVVLVAVLLAIFVYNWHYSTVIGGFDRKLITTSALTGALIDAEDHDQLIAAALGQADSAETEQTAEYQRNVLPIRRIRSKLDLTYLYTQIIGGPRDILYILDASEGDEHSPIGSDDQLTKQTLAGLKTTETDGSIFVSPIEYQEQWGLLKTAAAPVYAADGRASATAGADVNISMIQVATQNALFASTLIGIASVLACLLVTLAIVRRVASPLEALKDEALKIAAGNDRRSQPTNNANEEPFQENGPREVTQLSDAIAGLAAKLASNAADRQDAEEMHEASTNAALLLDEGQPVENGIVQLSDQGGTRIFWVSQPAEGSGCLEAALTAQSMTLLAARFEQYPALAELWRNLTDTPYGTGICIDDQSGTIGLTSNAAVKILRNDIGETLEPGSPMMFDAELDAVVLDGSTEIRFPIGSKPQVRAR